MHFFNNYPFIMTQLLANLQFLRLVQKFSKVYVTKILKNLIILTLIV